MHLEPLMPGTSHPEMVEVPDLCVRVRRPLARLPKGAQQPVLDPEVAQWCADHVGHVALKFINSRIVYAADEEGGAIKVVRRYKIAVLKFANRGSAMAFRLRWTM